MPSPRPSDVSDLRLYEQIRAGHSPALDVLLERYWTPVVRYAARILESRDDGSDIAQETFIRLWERRDRWDPNGSVRALLFQIARNLALDERKRQARWISFRRSGSEDRRRRVATPLQDAQRSELEAAFEQALKALPERRREVFLHVRLHGLSYQETADVMGIAPQTVANQLSAALNSLRDVLRPFLDAPEVSEVSSNPTRAQR